MEQKYYIGLDIGGTKCAMTLGKADKGIEILKKEQFLTEGQEPQRILDRFCSFIDEQLRENRIFGIGISCGGPLDSKRGVILKPPSLPLWDNIEIVKFFEDRYSIPTYLQNDANACAVAEWKYGAGRGCQNVIFLTFGTGFGAGLILNGRLYTGANDNAGEIGHVRLTKNGPMGYNKEGSCEGYCSGGGIARLARIMAEREMARGNTPIAVQECGIDNLSAKTLADYARSGDKFAIGVYKKSGEMLGNTLAILIDLFNPEKIIIGGVYMRSSDLLWRYAEKALGKEALSLSLDVCKIVPAAIGEEIGDFAALTVAKGDF